MAQESRSRKLDQYIVRFPDGMRDRIREEAEKNGRSMNAEIVARLEDSFSQKSENADVFKWEAKRYRLLVENAEAVMENLNHEVLAKDNLLERIKGRAYALCLTILSFKESLPKPLVGYVEELIEHDDLKIEDPMGLSKLVGSREKHND